LGVHRELFSGPYRSKELGVLGKFIIRGVQVMENLGGPQRTFLKAIQEDLRGPKKLFQSRVYKAEEICQLVDS
jgi:hypothetical protein